MDTNTLLVSFMTIIVLGIVILVVYEFTYGLWSSTASGLSPSLENVTVVGALQDGHTYQEFNTVLPLSNNETEGIEYSFVAWILVNDFDPPNPNPVIFTKGGLDLAQQSPSVTLTSGKNQITIVQDTYDKANPEKVVIGNLPAGKFLHLAICVNQKSMDVYVNGMLYKHSTLRALPLQNTKSVHVAGNGGWTGQIGSFIYYNYELSADDVRGLANTPPTQSANSLPYYPKYLSTDWWIGTHH